jgi:tetratricopeptide (TPR) repeat protein
MLRSRSTCERALALDRNLAHAHGWIGFAKFLIGRSSETEGHVNEALRLSPRDTCVYRWIHFVGLAIFQLGADAEAAAWFRRSIEANRNHPSAHLYLAVALTRLSALDEAKAAGEVGLALDPSFTMRRLRKHVPSDHPAFLAMRERY